MLTLLKSQADSLVNCLTGMTLNLGDVRVILTKLTPRNAEHCKSSLKRPLFSSLGQTQLSISSCADKFYFLPLDL